MHVEKSKLKDFIQYCTDKAFNYEDAMWIQDKAKEYFGDLK